MRALAALAFVFALATLVHAAPVTLEVDSRGQLVIPRATLRKLKLTPARGLICVEFPAPPPKGPTQAGPDHDHDAPAGPPRVWAPVRKDGALVISPMKVETAGGVVPGKPGARWSGTVRRGALVLTRAASPPRR